MGYWVKGLEYAFSVFVEAVKKGIKPPVPFLEFSEYVIENSDRSQSTKDNMRCTLKKLAKFRKDIYFRDINYAFLRAFDQYLRDEGLKVNTIGKHLRITRTLVNEAINEGHMQLNDYPFRKFKIKRETKEHIYLDPEEFSRMESLEVSERKRAHRHVLDAFLFCCYTGLRFSDFISLNSNELVTIDGNTWISKYMLKTSLKVNIPIYLLFNGKAIDLIRKYGSVERMAAIGGNPDVNKKVKNLALMADIHKDITFHTSRHTCATMLIYQGVPITTVQKVLGHTSIRTTQIYSEIIPETMIRDLRAANNKSPVLSSRTDGAAHF